MPRRASTSSSKGTKGSKPTTKKPQNAQGSKRATRKPAAVADSSRLIDDHAKRDIIGIAFIILAVILFIAAILPSSGLVTGFVSRYMRLGIGIGVFILPLFLAAIGVIVIVRSENERVPARVVVGLTMIFFAILVLLALCTPDAQGGQAEILFDQHVIIIRGGYVGAGVAWAGINLFGQIISIILMVGLVVAGLAIIGLSISRFTEKVREIRANRASQQSTPSARILKGRNSVKEEKPSRKADSMLKTDSSPNSRKHPAQSEISSSKTRALSPDIVKEQALSQAPTRAIPKGASDGHEGASQSFTFGKQQTASVDQGVTRTLNEPMFIPLDSAFEDVPAMPKFLDNFTGPDDAITFSAVSDLEESNDLDRSFMHSDGKTAPQNNTKRTRNTSAFDTTTDDTMMPKTRKLGSFASSEEDESSFFDPIALLDDLAQEDQNLAIGAVGAVVGATVAASANDSEAKKTTRKKATSTKKKPASPIAQPHPQDGFVLPPFDMLAVSTKQMRGKASNSDLEYTAAALQQTLQDFNINATVVGWIAGPTVTLFKVDLPAGVRVNRVTNLSDDIALALATSGIRIFAPIPGTNYVGIEVPNKQRQTVLLGDVLSDASDGPLQMAIGKDVEGNSIVSDLAKMPHLLIGGTTGSGKSVSINAMIMSILMRATPAEVRFILIDPKRVEFTPYNGIPHLYVPVVTEAKEAASALSWGVAEMERRLKVFSKVGARNIGQYNAKVQSGLLEDESAEEIPYIVIVIDELADLMMNVGKEVEFSISRIAQLARAAGIHLIVATQRPSANVVTGLIKANITNRIAFNVASGIDSRVILDTPGAEHLIGLGDLLLSKPELAKPQRIQGCYVSEDEIYSVVEFLKEQAEPEYHSEILKTNLITLGASQPDGSGGSSSDDDPLIWEAAEIVVSAKFGSTSNIQRRLKVGYSRAGRIMDSLEEKGIVGPANGSKPREVLVDALELESLKALELSGGLD